MSDMEKAQKELRGIHATTASLKKECGKLEAKKKDLTKDCDNLALESKVLGDKVGGLKKKKSDFDSHASAKRSDIGEAHATLLIREAKADKADKSNQRLKALNLGEQARLSKYRAELDETDVINSSRAANNKIIEGRLQKQLGDNVAKANKLDAEIMKALDKSVEIERERKAQKNIISAEIEELKKTRAQASIDTAECEKLKGEMQAMHKETEEQDELAKEIVTKCEARMADIKRIEGDLKRQKHDMEIKEQEVEISRLRVVKLAKDRGVTKDLEKLQKELGK